MEDRAKIQSANRLEAGIWQKDYVPAEREVCVTRDVIPDAQSGADYEQKLLLGAVEGMSEAFALFDPADRLIFSNETFQELNPGLAGEIKAGTTFERMLRNNIDNGRIVEALGREEVYFEERMARHREPGPPFIMRRENGCWLLIKEERGPDGSTFLINTDLTKLKQHEDALQRSKEAAERASGLKSEFLAKMSHELRTPLNAIIGFSDILKGELFGPLGSAKYRDYADDILMSGQHLLNLINDVLDLSKIEAGKYDLRIETVDIRCILREAERLVSGHVIDKGVRLRVTVNGNLPPIKADGRALRQILLNLLSNAIKFTPKDGCIHVLAQRDEGGDLCISVTDNGIGIPEDSIDTILIPFAQLGGADELHGVGLGLPIVNSLVHLHGGEMDVKSRYGKWTRISFRLPDNQPCARDKRVRAPA